MAQKTLIVGNWKMHLDTHQASLLLHRLNQNIKAHRNIEIVLAPSSLHLQPLRLQVDDRKFKLAAQNAYHKDEGAFTGEISFTMLRGLVKYAIVGHSERRVYFHEDLDTVRDKVSAALRNNIIPIVCVGETKQEKADGEGRQVLHDQTVTALSNVTSEEIENIVLVYEPQWTITTFDGVPAKPDEAAKAIDFIRRQVKDLYGAQAAKAVRVLYGGSVDEQLAIGYLEINGCDGLLIGSASLNYHKFSAIVDAAYRTHYQRTGNS